MENKALRGTAADFERIKRVFGLEEVERAVEDARRREAAEKEQRKAKRKFSRGGEVTDSGRALQSHGFIKN